MTATEIEDVPSGEPAIHADPFEPETRSRAIGVTAEGRHLYVVFTVRERGDGLAAVRPISARYMHEKEVRRYET